MDKLRRRMIGGKREKKSKKRKPAGTLAKFLYLGENAMGRFADRMALKGKS